MRAFLITVLIFAVGYCCGDGGLTLTVYDNTARAVSPGTQQSIIDSLAAVNFNTSEPFSADIVGTIDFNTSGVFAFNCTFRRTTLAFVWIDGHMVCQDGNAFNPGLSLSSPSLPLCRVRLSHDFDC